MPVPNIFGTATSAIPLSQLDTNFATPVTIGNTAVQLGNTVTSFGNVTLTNVTISSGNVTIAGANVSGTANVSTLVVTGNQSFVGTGNRITGDFSNATVASRVGFQSSTTNGTTDIPLIPNGTGANARHFYYSTSDTANASLLTAGVVGSEATFRASAVGTGTSPPMTFYTGGSERVRIDTSGNVGIGTNSPQSTFQVGSLDTGTSESTNKGLVMIQSAPGTIDTAGGLEFKTSSSGSGYGWKIGGLNASGDPFVIGNRANSATFTERVRIDASGNLLVGATTSSVEVGVGVKLGASATIPYVSTVFNTAGGANTYLLYNTNATNNGYRFYVASNGGVVNYSGNNVNLSDERTKTNIILADSYLDKICAIPVKLFNYKDEAEGEQRTLGVIAQDVEAVAPEFVNNDGWKGTEPEDGVPLKTIYTTDMMFGLMKAIQEQQALITTLTDRITALEAK
jgi:hypothetical protein